MVVVVVVIVIVIEYPTAGFLSFSLSRICLGACYERVFYRDEACATANASQQV